jgi:hypothetical protein
MAFEESNASIFLTSPSPDSPVQPISNQLPDPSPDKTGHNREMAFEESNASIFLTSPLPIRLFNPFPTNSLILHLIKQDITGKWI